MEKNRCPHCGQIVDEREIGLFSGMVYALKRIFEWCESTGKYEFQRKEVKHLLKSDNEIARFGDWILFGGLVYRPVGLGKGHYGINQERTRSFFANEYEIPTRLWKNPITGQISKSEVGTIDSIPTLKKFLNENWEFVARYRKPEQTSLI